MEQESTGLGRNTITGKFRVDKNWLLNSILYGVDRADFLDMRVKRWSPELANYKHEQKKLKAKLKLL